MPIQCQDGKYSLEAVGVCRQCPAGYSCLSRNQKPVQCKQGQYSIEGEASCSICPRGYQCRDKRGFKPCKVGYYSEEGATECLKCPAGFKCQKPHYFPVKCKTPEEYSLQGSIKCIECPKDHQCAISGQLPQPCSEDTNSIKGEGVCKKKVGMKYKGIESKIISKQRALQVSCSPGQYKNDSDVCVNCPAGFDCNDGHYYLRACPPGSYSLVSQMSCTVCPSGSKCPSATAGPTACDAGQFSLAGQVSCTECPPGFECPNKQGTSIAFCMSGKYSTGKQQSCSDCPIDKYCNAFEAIDCATTMYSPLGDYNCYWCPPGFSCNKAAGTKTACSNGQYSLERSLTCTACPTGFRCPNKGAAPYPCEPNTYSSAGATTCTVCNAGTYSFIGWSACQNLPAGYFVSNAVNDIPQLVQFGKFTSDGRTTGDCAAGKVCGEGAINNTGARDCPAGHYCKKQNNFVGIYPCPGGTYKATASSSTSSSDCTSCPAGKYCPPGTVTPKDCLPGFFCTAGTQYATQHPCPNNQWSNAGAVASGSCFACPDGYKCFQGIKNFCQPGHYCKGTVTQCPTGTYQPYIRKTLLSQCLTCPKGHYCDATNMHTPKPCPAGTYNHQTGQDNVSACLQCAAGSICPQPMTIYQNDGTITPQRFPCEPGHFCPTGSQDPLANPCPAHYYGDRTDLKSASQCSRCPEGFWCPQGATFFGQASKNVLDVDNNPGNKPILCPQGWYCPLNGDAVKCPAGSWNPTRGAFSLDYCKPCPAGYTCGLGTGSKPSLCATHSYCPPGSSSSISCPSGTYSPHDGTLWPNYMAAGDVADCFPNHPGMYGRNQQCPKNKYNPFFWGKNRNAGLNAQGCYATPQGFSTNNLKAQMVPSPCPIGKYSARGSDCQNCPASYYCDELGLGQTIMRAEKLCPDGYYCPGGLTGERHPCPIGKFCNAGVSSATNCSSGTWSFTIRQGGSSCPAMIAGYYHKTDTHQALLCPKGKYCTGSNTQNNLADCPRGTFNPYLGAKSSSYCVPCPIGFQCPNLATIDPQICPKGSYCQRGTTNGTPCPAGTFSNSKGLKKEADCIDCYAGSFCSGTGNTSSSSSLCDAGYICRAKSTSATQQLCPKYAYCPQGIPVPTNCLPGKYNSLTGKALASDCLTCPPGQYCTGITDPQTCAAGYFCTGGSSTQFQNVAQVGNKAAAGDSSQTLCPSREINFDIGQSSCQRCPKGYMCTGGRLHDCYTTGTVSNTDDDFNKYCGESQAVAKCGSGKMNLFQNAQDSSYCVPCLPGFKCNSGMVLQTQAALLSTSQYTGGRYGWQGTQYTSPAGFSTQASLPASYQFPCPAGAVQPTTGTTTLACSSVGATYASLGGYAYGVSCADGFQCISDQKHWNPAPCEIGYMCVRGVKTKCSAGQYQPIAGKSYCLPVKKGKYRGVSDATPQTCPAGSYCPEGSSSATPCPEGFYNPQTGRYDLSHCMRCDPGFFCAQGTSTLGTSQRCPVGKFCTIQAGTSYTGTCRAGHFCPLSSIYEQKCTPGSYCPTTNQGAVAGSCDGGHYCLLGATSRAPTNLSTQGGARCPAGTYCPSGSAIFTECQPGTFSSAVGASSSSTCQSCTAGKFCDKPKQSAVQGDCAAQFYCPTGSISKFSQPCTAGHKCVAGSSTPADCINQTPKGYQPNERSDFCITCPDGYTCTNLAKTLCDFSADNAQNKYCTNAGEVNCPGGKFIDFPGAGLRSDCIDCPPGMYCDNSSNKFQNCSGGVSCEGGQQAITGPNSAPDCPAGSYCPAGKRKLLCTAGRYCATPKLDSTTGACPAGYQCPQGTIAGTSNPCPRGAYCPQGTAFGIKCPPGTYLDLTGQQLSTDCKTCANLSDPSGSSAHCKGRGLIAPNANCEAGYFCDQGSLTEYEHLCPRGSHCPVNTKTHIQCVRNKYQAARGQEICFDCPNGYECANTGLTTITICSAGSKCPRAGQAKQACEGGTFGPKQGQNSCIPCTPGSYCSGGATSVTGSCSAGHICLGGAETATATAGGTGKVCPKGFYCQAGTMKELPCLPRTYGASTGLRSASECTKCPNGKFCPKYAMIDTQLGSFDCWAGYLCNDGSQVPNPITTGGRKCRKGTFCLSGATSETKCANGTYNAFEGQSACVQCPKGFRCNWSSASLPSDISINIDSVTPQDCPAGKYCPAGSITGTDCPAGTYNDRTKISTAAQCKSCPPGKYCVAGSTGVSLPDCNAGYACPGGSSTATPSSVVYSKNNNPRVNGRCPKGHKCSAGTSIPTPCQRGKYQPNTTQSACIACPQTKYCPEIGLYDEATLPNCADRFHCKSGAIVAKPITGATGNICQVGNFCLAGAQTQCVAGTFQSRQGSKECQDCPAGYYCPTGASSPTICPIGSYCPAKSTAATTCPDGRINQTLIGLQKPQQCVPCPQGFYCVAGVKNTCDPGYYCKSGNSVANPVDQDSNQTNYSNGPCPIGHYCNNPNTKFPQACSGDTFRTTPGGASLADCTSCSAGFFCPADSNLSYICPRGHYCPAGSRVPTACSFNSYNQTPQQGASSACILCNAAATFGTTYCNGAVPQPPLIKLDGYLCPVGNFCTGTVGNPNAISARQQCPTGSFQDEPGAANQCKVCEGGAFCGLGTIVPTPCDAGYYCPVGSETQIRCGPGKFCLQNVSAETPCPAAYYCPAGSISPIKCPNGTYCPLGSSSPISCPDGNYGTNNPNNVSAATGCIRCDRGTFTQDNGVTECQQCTPGYVCTGGTISSTPTDPARDFGFICPIGHYCPSGSFKATPCPVGTYNPQTGKSSINDCLSCQVGTYNGIVAQDGCKRCGPSATSILKATQCSCIGANRIYQEESGACICATGFTSKLGNEIDSKTDCIPEVSDSCSSGQIRNQRNQCVSVSDCSATCGNGVSGTRIEGIGFCNCNQVQDVDTVCNESCRNNQKKVIVKNNGMVSVNGGAQFNLLASVNGMVGEYSPCSNQDQQCKMISIGVDGSNGLSASYAQHSGLVDNRLLIAQQQNDDRQLQTTSSSINNPIVCIHTQDTFIFNIKIQANRAQSSYPVYVQSSLLNSDKSFDNSAFLKLQDRILNTSDTITFFAYQFEKSGLFVFSTSKVSSSYMIVRVLPQSQICPNASQFIQPTTEENLYSIGVQKQAPITTKSDWFLYGMMLLCFIIVLLGFFLLISIFHSKAIAREKQALLNEDQKQKTFCQRMFPCFQRRKRMQVGVGELEQQQLTLEELRQIKELAADLKQRLINLYEEKDDQFEDVYKHARKLDNKLKKISDSYKLQPQDGLLEIQQRRRKNLFESGLGVTMLQDQIKEENDNQQQEAQMKKKYQDKKFDDKIQKQVQQNMGQIETQLNERHKNNVDDLRKNLDSRLAGMDDLTAEQKRQLLLEQQTNLAREENLLKAEAKKQEDQLRRKLAQRKAKRRLLQNKIDQEEQRKKQVEDNFQRDLKEERERAEKDIQQLSDLDKLKEKQLKLLKKQFQQKRQGIKDDMKELLQERLNKTKVSQRPQLLQKFDQEQQDAMKKLEKQKKDRQEIIKDNIEDIAKQKRDQRKKEFEQARDILMQDKDIKMKDINAEIQRLAKLQENEKVDEYLNKLNIIQEENKRKENLKLRRQQQKELKELKRKQREAMENQDNQIKQSQAQVEHASNQNKVIRQEISKKQEKKEDLEKRFKQLQNMEDPESELEKKRLMSELSQYDKVLVQLERDLNKQKSKIQEKLLARKQKLKKKIQKRDEYNKDIEKMMDQQKEEDLNAKLHKLNEDFHIKLERIQTDLEKEELTYAIEKLIDDKQAEEMKILLAILMNQKFEKMKLILDKLFQNKLDELTIIKDQFRPKIQQLQDDKQKGRISSQQEYNQRFKDIKEEEVERKKDLDLKYFELQNEAEEKVNSDLENIHDKRVMQMKQKQLQEKNKYMKSMIARQSKHMKILEEQRKEAMQRQLDNYQNQMKIRLKQKMEEKEIQRAKLIQMSRESQERLRQFQQQSHKMSVEHENRQRERMEKRRADLQKRKNQVNMDLKNRTDLSEQMKKQLLQKHEQEMKRLEDALENERKRQQDVMSMKLNERRILKQKKRQEKDRKLMAFKLHKEQKIDKKLEEIKIPTSSIEKSQFAKISDAYVDNIKLFDKLRFPSSMSEQIEEKRKQRQKAGSIASSGDKKSFIRERSTSLAFTGARKKKADLELILTRLCDIQEMLNRI